MPAKTTPRKPAKKTDKKTLSAKPTKKASTGTRRVTASKKAAAAKAAKPEIQRLVVGADGKIIFATPTMIKAVGLTPESIRGMTLRDILNFAEPDEALHDRPRGIFGIAADDDAADHWTESIIPGEHKVVLAYGDLTAEQDLRFDRIDTPDGKSYLVISGEEAKEPDPGEIKKAIDRAAAPATKAATRSQGHEAPQSVWDSKISTFLAMGHDFLVLMSPRGKIIQSNEIFSIALGYEQNELVGKSFLDFVFSDDRPYIQPVFKTLVSSNNEDGSTPLVACECRVQAADKSIRWLDCRLKMDGGHLFMVARDLTEEKQHEAELLRREQQLSEAQSIGRMGHWTWRIGEERLAFSSEIYHIFGLTPDEFIPTIDSVNDCLHRRDRGRMAQAFQRAMIEQKNYEMEFRIIRPDGDVRFILLQGRCEQDDEGDVVALFGIMQDITERTHHERELCEAKEASERAYAAKSQFLANMSHELRTPLNAIIGFSEMIERQMLGPIGTEKYLEYIGGIRASGEHLLDLISDILDMSKIEAGKYKLDVEEFNIFKVMRLAVHMIEGRALDAQVRVISNLPENEDKTMIGDRRAIMQMVLNLLSNAVKFTEPGGEVRVDLSYGAEQVAITIEDTGIGIPASKLRYVTKPFEQAANQFTRNHEGSGLGLAITKELAELHGGTLTIKSMVGVGTNVRIELPRVADVPKENLIE